VGQTDLTFRGTKSNTSIVTQTFSVESTLGLATFLFSSTFTNLTALKWVQESTSHQFDNIVLDESVSAVPLPATLPLFDAGLAFMSFIGWRRKRKCAATA